MNQVPVSFHLVDSYFMLLKALSPDQKLELIARLSTSMQSVPETGTSSSLASLYGAWVSDESADDLIADLKKARTFNRKREAL